MKEEERTIKQKTINNGKGLAHPYPNKVTYKKEKVSGCHSWKLFTTN